MLGTIVRRAAQQAAQRSIHTNPSLEPFRTSYKAKRLWPPDFSKLSAKDQFRLERKYKRRSKLKWARPRWTKGVKIAQYSSVVFILVYSVLFLDWNVPEGQKQPFSGIRGWFFGLTGSIWSKDEVRRQPRRDDASPVSNSAT